MPSYNYGGQAVIEGVMMRGRHSAAVALRRMSGDVLLYEEQLRPRGSGTKMSQWPLVRGLKLLADTLVLGTRMMRFAANVRIHDELNVAGTRGVSAAAAALTKEQPGPVPVRLIEADPEQMAKIGGPGLVLAVVISLGAAIVLFFLLPLGVVSLLPLGASWWSLLAEGLIRLALLVGYLVAVGRAASVKRVFEYHGAEHKAINTYEAGRPLSVEQVRQASRVHTRCGTGFLLIVVVLSILVFALLGHPPLPLLVLSRILLVPIIAAAAYELLRLGAANYRYPWVRWLMAPSLALQGLTTREPDDQQIECAIIALERVLKSDGVSERHCVA